MVLRVLFEGQSKTNVCMGILHGNIHALQQKPSPTCKSKAYAQWSNATAYRYSLAIALIFQLLAITRRCYQEGNACVGAECLCLTNDLRKNTDKRVLPSYTDLACRNWSLWAYSYGRYWCSWVGLQAKALFEGTTFLTTYWLWTTGASCPLYRLPFLPNRAAPTRRKRSVVVALTSRWRPWRQWRDVTRCVDVALSSRCRVDVRDVTVTATRACYTRLLQSRRLSSCLSKKFPSPWRQTCTAPILKSHPGIRTTHVSKGIQANYSYSAFSGRSNYLFINIHSFILSRLNYHLKLRSIVASILLIPRWKYLLPKGLEMRLRSMTHQAQMMILSNWFLLKLILLRNLQPHLEKPRILKRILGRASFLNCLNGYDMNSKQGQLLVPKKAAHCITISLR